MGRETPSVQTELRIVWENKNYMSSWNIATALRSHSIASEWAFDEMTNGDWMAKAKGPKTGTGKTEVHILSTGVHWNQFQLERGTS